MKSEKGITLASLAIYIIVILIALITLTTITTYFRSNVNQFNTKTTIDLEFDKFNLYFIEEVKKTNNEIDEENSTETKVVFTSGNIYEFSENSIILNGNVKIAEKIEACTFSFSADENNKQSVTVYMKVGETERTNEYTLSNKVLENTDNEDYIYGYKRVDGTNKLNLANSSATNLKSYRIYGNSVQDGTPTPDSPIEIQSVGDKTVNLLDAQRETIEITGNPTTAVELDTTKVYLSYAGSGYFSTARTNDLEITKSEIKFSSTYAWYGVGFPIEVEPSKTYTISWGEGSENARVNYTYYSQGTFLSYSSASSSVKQVTITTPSNADMVIISLVPTNKNEIITFKNLQFQEGASATDYEPYGYKVPIKISGKNLFDGILKNGQFSWGEDTKYRRIEILLEPGTYTISFSDLIYMQGSNIVNTGIYYANTFTINETMDCVFQFRGNDIQTEEFYSSLKIQIENNDIVNEYEPYSESITTNIYLDEPLRKIGDYADYIDFENQKVVRKVERKIFTGEENWYQYGSNIAASNWCNKNDIVRAYSKTLGYRSNIAVESATPEQEISNNTFSTHNLENVNWVVYNINRDLQVWKNFITESYANSNPVILEYVLATPTEELIELPTIKVNESTTTLTIDTEIPPSNTEVVYYSK